MDKENILTENEYYVYPKLFKTMFMDWCLASGKQKPNWSKDYYKATFIKYNIIESPSRKKKYCQPEGKDMTCVWYYGMAFSEYMNKDEEEEELLLR